MLATCLQPISVGSACRLAHGLTLARTTAATPSSQLPAAPTRWANTSGMREVSKKVAPAQPWATNEAGSSLMPALAGCSAGTWLQLQGTPAGSTQNQAQKLRGGPESHPQLQGSPQRSKGIGGCHHKPPSAELGSAGLTCGGHGLAALLECALFAQRVDEHRQQLGGHLWAARREQRQAVHLHPSLVWQRAAARRAPVAGTVATVTVMSAPDSRHSTNMQAAQGQSGWRASLD